MAGEEHTGEIRKTETDLLVAQLFRTQEELNPDTDPGDLTIVVQDDMAVTEVNQNGATIFVGRSLTEALEGAIQVVRSRSAPS